MILSDSTLLRVIVGVSQTGDWGNDDSGVYVSSAHFKGEA